MTYREFVKSNIEKTLGDLGALDTQIEKFPSIDNFDYRNYGTREEILRQYSEFKKKRFKFFSRIKDSDLNEFVYRREVKRLQHQRLQMEDKLQQLMETMKSFNGKGFNKAIIPNNFVVQSILEFGELKKLDMKDLLDMIMSLFKKISMSEEDFVAIVERNLAENFDENLQLRSDVSLSSVLFMLDKIIRMLCPNDFAEKYETTIIGLKNEVSLQFESKEPDERREDLEKKKKNIAELKEYINGDEIIKIAPSLDYFRRLLEEAGIDGIQQKRYVSSMSKLIRAEEIQESKRLTEKYLDYKELIAFGEALTFLEDSENTEVNKFLSRILKDIVSLCKYMEDLEIPEEMQMSYDAIALKLQTASTIVSTAKENIGGNNIFYYLTDDNNVPCILNNIASIDSLHYDEIFRVLLRLSRGENGVVVDDSSDISFEYIDGNSIKVYYAKKGGTIVVVGAEGDTIYGSKIQNLPNDVHNRLKRIFEVADKKDIRKNHEIFEMAILQMLDLNYLVGDETNYSLRKQK